MLSLLQSVPVITSFSYRESSHFAKFSQYFLTFWFKIWLAPDGFQVLVCKDSYAEVKGVIYDSGESLLIFELNSQTNTPLPSVLLQARARNAQH